MNIVKIHRFRENQKSQNYDVLWSGKWIDVISPKGPNMEYEALHDKQPLALGIIYLEDVQKYIIRKEFCPPYMIFDDQPRNYYTLLSGGIEEGETPLEAFLREIREEAGIEAIEYSIVEEKKNIPIMKGATTRGNFFLLKVSKYEVVEALGDGTINEELSSSLFLSYQELYDILHDPDNVDFLLYGMYHVVLERRDQLEKSE